MHDRAHPDGSNARRAQAELRHFVLLQHLRQWNVRTRAWSAVLSFRRKSLWHSGLLSLGRNVWRRRVRLLRANARGLRRKRVLRAGTIVFGGRLMRGVCRHISDGVRRGYLLPNRRHVRRNDVRLSARSTGPLREQLLRNRSVMRERSVRGVLVGLPHGLLG